MTRRGGDKWQQKILPNSKVSPWLGGWQYTSLKYKDQRCQINKTHTKHYTHSHIVHKNDFLTYQASSCTINLNYSKQNYLLSLQWHYLSFHVVHFSSTSPRHFFFGPHFQASISRLRCDKISLMKMDLLTKDPKEFRRRRPDSFRPSTLDGSHPMICNRKWKHDSTHGVSTKIAPQKIVAIIFLFRENKYVKLRGCICSWFLDSGDWL